MPYDPNFPPHGAELISADFRNQFHGIKDLIDGVPGITSVQVDAVNTLPAGQPANVTASVVGQVLHLTFAIPQGNDGPQGAQGMNGSDGGTGPQGEVTNVALAAAITGTSANTNAVTTLDTPFADPDMETLRAKFNELILAARRV